MSLYHKIVPPSNLIPGVSKPGPRDPNTTRPKLSFVITDAASPSTHGAAATSPQSADVAPAELPADTSPSAPSTLGRTFSPNPPESPAPRSLVPIMESVDHALKDTGLQPAQLPPDDFTRAVAVATVSALRHQQVQARRVKGGVEDEDHEGHAGHDGPSWSRAVSASVLLACTALYAAIAGTCLQSAHYPKFVLFRVVDRLYLCRDTGGCRRRRAEWFRYRRKVPRSHAVRARAQHDRVHECDVICYEWQYCAQVRLDSVLFTVKTLGGSGD